MGAAKKPAKRVKAGTKKLSADDRKVVFVEAYLSNNRNGTKAALLAGFSERSAASQASRLLKDPKVAQLLDSRRTELVAALEMNTEKTLREVGRLAFSDLRNITNTDGSFKKIHELDDDTAAAVASYKVSADGTIEYKFWDKNSALEKAAKVQGLFEKDNKQKNPLDDVSRDDLQVIRERLSALAKR